RRTGGYDYYNPCGWDRLWEWDDVCDDEWDDCI
nr:hypothetical protein [Tanacetum cinerariifolium]